MKFLPGLDSYRARFLYFIAIAATFFSLFAYFGWKHITEASELTQRNIAQRNQNTGTLNHINRQMIQTRVLLYQYSLDPLQFSEVELNRALTELLQKLALLDITVFETIDSDQLNDFSFQLPPKLHAEINKIIALRKDTDHWIPAAYIMSQSMAPLGNEISDTLTSMINDLDIESAGYLQLKSEILDMKATWNLTKAVFRLFAVSRFGLFDNTLSGMQNRAGYLNLLLDKMQRQIMALQPLMQPDEYSFMREVFYPKLQRDTTQWVALQRQAIHLLQQKDWRKDLPVLRKINSLFNQFNHTIIAMQADLDQQLLFDIQRLDQINQTLSIFITIMGLITFVFFIFIYLILNNHILRPIEFTTHAMLEQSKGVSHELNLQSSARETRQLIQAFNQMSTQIQQRENHLDYLAHHDMLTGLPNRQLFNERLQHALDLIGRNNKLLVVMLLDLDRFKLINDTLGHLFGDKLLQQTAARLLRCMRAEDTIARLGGDEFAIIVEGLSEPAEVDIFAKKIVKQLKKPFFIDGEKIHITTSIGVALAPGHSRQPTTLVRYADIAMYQSKNSGGNQYCWFDNSLENAEQSMIQFENQLRVAITHHQFEIHYQPLIDTRNHFYIGCEALLRWRHPERGLLYPGDFIGILENSEILYDLTCWLIRKTQAFQRSTRQQTGVTPIIAINLPAIIFQNRIYREKIFEILTREVNSAKYCVIEITEDTLISDLENTSVCLNKLHQQGFKIALDDFGTGQSSLSHLRAFPIDIIKIDRTFIRDIQHDKNDANLVSAIISMGHYLGLRVIAEGVEEKQQLDFLDRFDCHLIQGYYFSRPLAEADYLQFIQRQLQAD